MVGFVPMYVFDDLSIILLFRPGIFLRLNITAYLFSLAIIKFADRNSFVTGLDFNLIKFKFTGTISNQFIQ
jgi:hypothetical protein